MNIRRVSILSACAVGVVGCANGDRVKSGVKYPNIVIINLDDAGLGDFSYLGALGYETPNIDAMAKGGLTLSNFYAVQPISGASRCGLMTGCYPNRVGFAYAPNPNSPIGLHADEVTMAELLKQNDYATAIYGKWHLGDAEQFLPLQNGFDDYYGLPYSNDMWPFHPQYDFPDIPLLEGNKVLGYNTDQSELTTEYTKRTVEFIRENGDNPFFVYLAHSMPHVPLAVSDKFKGKSQQGLYGDVMMELDWSVGQVMATLKGQGLEQNTIVILTSDNGPWANYGNHAGSSGGLREAKATTFNGGLRVPCVVSWPGVVAEGTNFNGLLSNIDIFPTIAELTESKLPKHKIDGVSFAGVMRGGVTESPRDYLALYYHKNSMEAITDGEFKLVFPHKYVTYNSHVPGDDGAPGELGADRVVECELYDLRRDAGERVDVISQHPEIYKELSEEAHRWRQELGDDLMGVEGEGRREIGKKGE